MHAPDNLAADYEATLIQFLELRIRPEARASAEEAANALYRAEPAAVLALLRAEVATPAPASAAPVVAATTPTLPPPRPRAYLRLGGRP
jgi:hypothetical protein